MDNIEKIILSTSQSMKELNHINKKIKVINKRLDKVILEEKKRILTTFLVPLERSRRLQRS